MKRFTLMLSAVVLSIPFIGCEGEGGGGSPAPAPPAGGSAPPADKALDKKAFDTAKVNPANPNGPDKEK